MGRLNCILRDPGQARADKTGETDASWSLMRAKVYKTGRNSPWEDTFNGLIQEPICVLASDWAQNWWHCIFCVQSAISLFHRSFRDVLYSQSVTLLNLVPSCHSCVLKSTFCLARSRGLLSVEVFNSNMRTHKAEKSRNLGGVIKGKENNKYENQIEVL